MATEEHARPSEQGVEGAAFRLLSHVEVPVFRRVGRTYMTYYSPGCLCVVDAGEAERFERTIAPVASATGSKQFQGWGQSLWQSAAEAVVERNRQATEPFQPECLTLYLNNECNLSCTYCFSDPQKKAGERLELDAISAAADLVAANCRTKSRPLYAIVHGGGEPTLDQAYLEAVLQRVRLAARAHRVPTWFYVASNGVLSSGKARWLAGQFDLVGLSCDGPAEIHNRQRPLLRGQNANANHGSLAVIERTACIIREEGKDLHVRATITARSVERQAEIASYICQQLAPSEIHFEPVYHGGRTGSADTLTPTQAEGYVAGALEAQAVAQGYGIPLRNSGSRPGSVHGPFCHVFRQVLNLAPGGLATACFKLSRSEEIRKRAAATGMWDRGASRFVLDVAGVAALRERLGVLPTACQGCFNSYHCARGCPDICPLDTEQADGSEGAGTGFRCLTQKATTLALLTATAQRLWSEVRALKQKGPHGTRDLETLAP
jgi:sulfatase maturation enzyme AslB (radical SAM superfamily)